LEVRCRIFLPLERRLFLPLERRLLLVLPVERLFLFLFLPLERLRLLSSLERLLQAVGVHRAREDAANQLAAAWDASFRKIDF
jgi:hypothetical protein